MITSNRLADLINELVEPWFEKVEYSTPVCVHTHECRAYRAYLHPSMRKHMHCSCPLKLEHRTERVRQDSLLDQLTKEASGYAPIALGGRGTKPTSRPPATLDMVDLLGSIDNMLTFNMAEGKSRMDRLRNLVSLSLQRDDEWTKYACMRVRRYIKTARIMLGYDVPKRVLREVMCGACNGALVVATDASSDVVCVSGCGQTYRRYEWVDLLEQ